MKRLTFHDQQIPARRSRYFLYACARICRLTYENTLPRPSQLFRKIMQHTLLQGVRTCTVHFGTYCVLYKKRRVVQPCVLSGPRLGRTASTTGTWREILSETTWAPRWRRSPRTRCVKPTSTEHPPNPSASMEAKIRTSGSESVQCPELPCWP